MNMSLQICLFIVALVYPILGNPQFLKFEDGKIGVNFGGYHAEAGLGGLLTGNVAHGGLSASAGTPYGQNAAAGIGGSLNGGTSGGAYAGATAGNGIGAGALLGGNVGSGGGSVGIASANSYSNSGVKEISIVDEKPPTVDATYSNSFSAGTSIDKTVSLGNTGGVQYVENAPQTVTYVQKIKKIHHHPHKVFYTETVPQTQTNTQIYSNIQQSVPIFGFGKIFNFGLFANKGLFGQRHRQTITTTNVQPETIVVPQVVYEKRVIPKVVYEKRIVPEVVVEKKIIPQTVVVEKPVVTVHQTPKLNIHKEITFGKRIDTGATAGVSSGAAVAGVESISNAGASGVHSNNGVDVTGTYGFQKSGIINDIFNIPISTLQAVNRLLNNKVGGGNISVQKTVEFNKK